MHSCLYFGHVRHRRFAPVVHRFRYSLWMAYLDLEEVPGLHRRGLLGSSPWGMCSFREADHADDGAGESLAERIRRRVAEQTGVRFSGPVRLLTLLRTLGHYFNPLGVYYLFDDADPAGLPQAIVAEVSNTPWNERHRYVLWEGNRTSPSGRLRFELEKAFHVSPFMDMRQRYRFALTVPGKRLTMHLENQRDERTLFDATLHLQRLLLTRGNLLRCSVRHPLQPISVLAAIYYQAWRLWCRRCPFYPHPDKLIEASTAA